MSVIPLFVGNKNAVKKRENAVIAEALRILERRMTCYGVTLMSPDDCKAFFKMRLGELSKGDYGVLFLDESRKPVRYEELGNQLDIRAVLRVAIDVDAVSVVVGQNQTTAEASRSIAAFRSALHPVNIDLLDYVLLQGQEVMSCFEQGLFSVMSL